MVSYHLFMPIEFHEIKSTLVLPGGILEAAKDVAQSECLVGNILSILFKTARQDLTEASSFLILLKAYTLLI